MNTILNLIVAALWQAVDENSSAYQAGRSMVIILVAVVVIVVLYNYFSKKSK